MPKTAIPETAPCLRCGEPAPWDDTIKRYRHVHTSAPGRLYPQGKKTYVTFLGPSGYCEARGCTHLASVTEPLTRAHFNDFPADGEPRITYDAPNVAYLEDSTGATVGRTNAAGHRFCGTHSPSAKAERDAKRAQQRWTLDHERKARRDAVVYAAQEQTRADIELVRGCLGHSNALEALDRLAVDALGYYALKNGRGYV